MISIRCKCDKVFEQESNEDSFTFIFACPYCNKNWRNPKVSGIDLEVYPELESLLALKKTKGEM